MTEQEWRAGKFPPSIMLDFVRRKARLRDRKLRLFACALVRTFAPKQLEVSQGRHAVEVSERYGDGEADLEELVAARRAAVRAGAHSPAAIACMHGRDAAQVWGGLSTSARGGLDASEKDRARVDRVMIDILHDLFGPLPFRPVNVDPAWLRRNGGVVSNLVRAIYDERAFDRLPVLADALEEAGCADAEILDHCHAPGPHVRGCWAVDLLLGKS